MLAAAFLNRLGAIAGEGNLLTDAVSCLVYGYDNSRKIFPPEAVVFATSTASVQQIVLLCNEFKVPLTPRGRGTGTAGASIPEQGGVALSLERMRRIVAVDPANRVLVCEPGVLNQEVQDAARPHGFFWPPDPSSAPYCSIGGNLATCAGGPHAVKYGVTRDHVLGLTAVTGKGEIIKTGCYTTKGVVGYDLTRLLIGSEGTLAIITEATLKLTPLPAAVGGLTAHYRDISSCARAIAAIMAQPALPSALEFLDQASLNLIRARHPGLLPEETRALLMIEVDGSASEVQANAETIRAACTNDGLIRAEIAPDLKALWAARKALSPLLRDIAPKKINEDVVVPVSHLPELLQGLAELSAKYGVANANFGHAGNGNMHVNLLVNPDDADQMLRAEACLDEIFTLVLRLNGTLSGEHGVGREKRPFVTREIDPVTLQLMRDIKQVFDPNNILNPGKLFPESKMQVGIYADLPNPNNQETSMSLTDLNQNFAIPGHVTFKEGPGGLTVAEVANSFAESTIALQGAHIMTFTPRGQEPVVWLSKFAKFAPGKSIRGGVPICWPWFGPHATDAALPGHGFARTVMWDVLETRAMADGATFLRFGLIENDATRAQWPHASTAQLEVTVGAALRVELVTRNTGKESFVLGEALHTYFHISDVAKMKITGLEGCDYLDKVGPTTRRTQQDAIVIESEVDRVYLNTSADCLIEDSGFKRRIRVAGQNARSAVVWNPWVEKADKMGDFGPEGYRGMVCVETANAVENVVTVKPGEEHRLVAVYSAEALA